MGKVEKHIVGIQQANGDLLKVGQEVDGYILRGISFRRDGFYPVAKTHDPEGYVLLWVSGMSDKDSFMDFIPYRQVSCVRFIEVEETEDNKDKVHMEKVE